jgi:hypothetical protein
LIRKKAMDSKKNMQDVAEAIILAFSIWRVLQLRYTAIKLVQRRTMILDTVVFFPMLG